MLRGTSTYLRVLLTLKRLENILQLRVTKLIASQNSVEARVAML